MKHLIVDLLLFLLLVEHFKSLGQQIRVKGQLVRVLSFYVTLVAFSCFVTIVRWSAIAIGVDLGGPFTMWFLSVLLILGSVLCLLSFENLSKSLLVNLLIAVNSVYQQVHILHLLDAQASSDGIDFDGELVFQALALTLLHSLVIDEVSCLVNKQFEDILDFLVFFTNLVRISSGLRLVVD